MWLQIDSSQVQDSGRYTCEATNVAGKTEKNYNLNVWGEFHMPTQPYGSVSSSIVYWMVLKVPFQSYYLSVIC